MLDPFGIHRRRVRRQLAGVPDLDAIEAFERDYVNADYWVLTSSQLVHLRQSDGRNRRMALAGALVDVRRDASGVSVHLTTGRPGDEPMQALFRRPNKITRQLEAVVRGG